MALQALYRAGADIAHRVLGVVEGVEGVGVKCFSRQAQDAFDDNHPLPGGEVEAVVDHTADLLAAPAVENRYVAALEHADSGIERILRDEFPAPGQHVIVPGRDGIGGGDIQAHRQGPGVAADVADRPLVRGVPVFVAEAPEAVAAEFVDEGVAPVAGIEAQFGFLFVRDFAGAFGRILVADRTIVGIEPGQVAGGGGDHRIALAAGPVPADAAVTAVVDDHQDGHFGNRPVPADDIRAIIPDKAEDGVVIGAHIAVGTFAPAGIEIAAGGGDDVAVAVGDVGAGAAGGHFQDPNIEVVAVGFVRLGGKKGVDATLGLGFVNREFLRGVSVRDDGNRHRIRLGRGHIEDGVKRRIGLVVTVAQVDGPHIGNPALLELDVLRAVLGDAVAIAVFEHHRDELRTGWRHGDVVVHPGAEIAV